MDENVQQQIQEAFDLFERELKEGKVTGVVLIIKGYGLDEYQAAFACKSNYVPSMVEWMEKAKESLMKFIEV